MKTYGTITCPDCGILITKTSPNTKRCKPCALSAHGQTGVGFVPKSCERCNVVYTPSGASQKVCDTCKPEFRREKESAAKAKIREASGRPAKGSIQQCSSCGDDFIYRSSVQHRCGECQRKFNMRRIHEWLAENPEIDKTYRKRYADNRLFDGNRKVAMERDNHACQHCGSVSDLQVHHIDGNGVTSPKEQRNNDLANLLTLCRSCHTKVHHKERNYKVS